MKQTLFGLLAVAFLIFAGTAFAQDGAAIYGKSCAACHNALKTDVKSKGVDALVAATIAGKGAMRPRAGTSLSDDEIKAAVIYMQSRVK